MFKSLSIALLCYYSTAQPNPVAEGEKHVREFTKTDFDYKIVSEKSQDWFVLFQSPGCGHCQKFKPTFHKLAYDNLSSKTLFGDVNCKEQSDLCKMVRIKAYPTLVFFRNGLMHKFEGPRNEDTINEFIWQGYTKVPGVKIPTELPTFTEEIFTALAEMYDEIRMIYRSGHIILKVCISVFLMVVGGLIMATLFFIYDMLRAKKLPVEAARPKRD